MMILSIGKYEALFSKANKPSASGVFSACVIGIFAVSLHYGFTYAGLSLTDSSKTAILKQAAPLLFACFSFLFFKDERFSLNKILGALIGFCGIVSINAGASFKGFALGDTLIISASVCTVISMIIIGKAAKGYISALDNGNFTIIRRQCTAYNFTCNGRKGVSGYR